MTTTLFLQSEVPDPYKVYETMLGETPVYWDHAANLWAIYSYAACKTVLDNPVAQIPVVSTEGLNEYASLIADKLARINNGVGHEIARQTAIFLFVKMKTISIAGVVKELIEKEDKSGEIDWVNKVCRKLPVTVVLKSFDFNEADSAFISSSMDHLIKIMLPNKTREQIATLNVLSKEIYAVSEKHFLKAEFYKSLVRDLGKKYKMTEAEMTSYCVTNLIGLLIQSYDAGRGILSNSLLQILNHADILPTSVINKEHLQKMVVETLRFDPPVHNTRRVAASTITIGNDEIKKEQQILIVLAAANRDPLKFNHPDSFDIKRTNNNEHLTFGIGLHRCLAEHFSVNMATAALSYLFEKYKAITLIEKNIMYEPVINVRLPKNMLISLIK